MNNKNNGNFAFDDNHDIFIGNSKTFRFKFNKNISINPPSGTLHISNLAKEICREDFLRELFSSFGRIEQIKYEIPTLIY